jgi:hypothetical protein
MNETDRDPVVARALRELHVPDHEPGFWDRLERELADEGSGGGRAAVVDLAGARRRRSRTWLLATAAAVVTVVAAAALLSGRDDEVVTVPPVTETPTTEVLPPTTTTAAPTPTPEGPATADEAVLAWLDAIGAGEHDEAAALTGPRTRAYLESLGANLEGFLLESSEGYGAWAASPDRSTTEVELGRFGDAVVTVVVVSGTWTGEGDDGFRADAIPAVRDDEGGGWLVEPVAFEPDSGGRLELLSPQPASPGGSVALAPDGEIVVAAPGEGTFLFSLDDGAVVTVPGEPLGAGVQATFDPPGDLAARSYLLIVAYVDGATVTATAIVLEVSA